VKNTFAFALVLLFAISLGVTTSRPQQNKVNPPDLTLTDPERDLLNEINEARANPQLYASYLEKLKPLFSGRQYTAAGHDPLTTEEGWNAVDDAIKFLNAVKPLPPLIPSHGLSQAALTHVKDQETTGGIGHKGGDSMMIEDRVKPFGRWEGAIGENITYGNESARERLLTWLIDDGVPSRGHRRRLMSSDYQVVGISCGTHPQFKAMCVLTLAGGFTEFNPATVPLEATTSTSTPKTTTTSTTKSGTSSAKPGKPRNRNPQK